jgi:hypothetical protein
MVIFSTVFVGVPEGTPPRKVLIGGGACAAGRLGWLTFGGGCP